jgi:hypothetical protein
MKTLATLALASTALLFVGTAANAHAFGPGLWSANGIQEICLVSGGTWYSPTYANWGGDWIVQVITGEEKGTLVGNYNSGAGNDSFVVKGSVMAWNEWSDDLSYVNMAGVGYVWSYLGSSCGEPAKGPNKHANPMQG